MPTDDPEGPETRSEKELAWKHDWPHSTLDERLARAAGEAPNPEGVPDAGSGGRKRR